MTIRPYFSFHLIIVTGGLVNIFSFLQVRCQETAALQSVVLREQYTELRAQLEGAMTDCSGALEAVNVTGIPLTDKLKKYDALFYSIITSTTPI